MMYSKLENQNCKTNFASTKFLYPPKEGKRKNKKDNNNYPTYILFVTLKVCINFAKHMQDVHILVWKEHPMPLHLFLLQEPRVQLLKGLVKITKFSSQLVSAQEVVFIMSRLLKGSFSRSYSTAFWIHLMIQRQKQTCCILLLLKLNLRTIGTRNQRSSPRLQPNM